MKHVFNFSYNFPRSMSREDYRVVSRYLRFARREVESCIDFGKFEMVVQDAMLYGVGGMLVEQR